MRDPSNDPGDGDDRFGAIHCVDLSLRLPWGYPNRPSSVGTSPCTALLQRAVFHDADHLEPMLLEARSSRGDDVLTSDRRFRVSNPVIVT